MLGLKENNQILTSQIRIKNTPKILDHIDTIQKINTLTKKSLESILNETILENFQKIDDIVANLQFILKQEKSSKMNTFRKPDIKMTDVSLLDILKHSIPRKMPSKVIIHLPEQDFTIRGAYYRLIVLFSSLIENSIQAMKNGGTIFITAVNSGDYVTIHVEDTGSGIPEHIMNKLFTKLVTSKAHGSGLGTTMAKSIVEIHGGQISVTNNPTIFTIKLPRSLENI